MGVAVFSSALVVRLRERVDSILKCVERGSTKKLQTQYVRRRRRTSTFAILSRSGKQEVAIVPQSNDRKA